jgi:hypothetical protein
MLVNLLGASWKTTVLGFVAGILTYLAQLGPNLPTTAKDWGTVLLSAAMAAFGLVAKDKNVSNSPTPLAVAQPVVISPTTGTVVPPTPDTAAAKP